MALVLFRCWHLFGEIGRTGCQLLVEAGHPLHVRLPTEPDIQFHIIWWWTGTSDIQMIVEYNNQSIMKVCQPFKLEGEGLGELPRIKVSAEASHLAHQHLPTQCC